MNWFQFLTIILFVNGGVSGFNIESLDGTLIANPTSTPSIDYFGYKLALKFPSESSSNLKLLVTSPKSAASLTKSESTSSFSSSSSSSSSLSSSSSISSSSSVSSYENEHKTSFPGDIFSCDVSFTRPRSSTRCISVRPPIEVDESGQGSANKDSLGIALASRINGGDEITVCAPLRVQNCSNTYFTYGTCYSSPDFGTTWSPDQKAAQKSCPINHLDLIFLLDGSSSVNAEGIDNFALVKDWVKTVAAGFDIKNSASIGVIQYSHYFKAFASNNQRYIKTEIALGQFSDLANFQAAVDKIVYQGQTTHTSAAINKTILDFKNSTYFDNPATQKILILLTDGSSTDVEFLEPSSNYARSFGIEIFAVGVADYNEEELLIITGREDRVFGIKTFIELNEKIADLEKSITTALEGENKDNDTNGLQQSETGLDGAITGVAGKSAGFRLLGQTANGSQQIKAESQTLSIFFPYYMLLVEVLHYTMGSQAVNSYLNSTNILNEAIENKCKNDPLPSASEILQSMDVATAVLHGILVFLTIVVLALFTEEIFYFKKHLKPAGRRHLSMLQAGVSPVFAVASVVGTFFPSGSIMIDFVYSVYFGFALHAFLVLMVDYYGGQRQLFLRFTSKTCVMHTGPFCCCCRCLPTFKMTKKNFTILWYATFQAAFTRPIILFFEGVFKGDNSVPIPSLVYSICLIVSMLIGMWALIIFRNASAEFLRRYHITGKFINFQAVLIISNIQPFIIKLTYRKCNLPFTYATNKLLLNYQLMVVEFFLLAVTTRLLYRRNSDNDQLEKIVDDAEIAEDTNHNKTACAKQPMLPTVQSGLKWNHVTVMAGNDDPSDPSFV